MENSRLQIVILSGILLFAVIIVVSLDAGARTPVSRVTVAMVQSVDKDECTLSLEYPQGSGPKHVAWRAGTEFFHAGKIIPVTELSQAAP